MKFRQVMPTRAAHTLKICQLLASFMCVAKMSLDSKLQTDRAEEKLCYLRLPTCRLGHAHRFKLKFLSSNNWRRYGMNINLLTTILCRTRDFAEPTFWPAYCNEKHTWTKQLFEILPQNLTLPIRFLIRIINISNGWWQHFSRHINMQHITSLIKQLNHTNAWTNICKQHLPWSEWTKCSQKLKRVLRI
jgi:hypothetical protein